MFGAGGILGPIRVLWLIPRLVSPFPEHAERVAELIEMPQRTFATKLKRYAILPEDWGGP